MYVCMYYIYVCRVWWEGDGLWNRSRPRRLWGEKERYSTTPRNGNPVNGNHLDICLSFSQKNGNSLTWVLVALPVCPTSPLRLRDSAEPRPNLELASGNCES